MLKALGYYSTIRNLYLIKSKQELGKPSRINMGLECRYIIGNLLESMCARNKN